MITKYEYDDTIVTDRGGVVENTHRVHAAVVDNHGLLLYAVGNPHRMTLARSATKPFQAIAILETEGIHQYDFQDADVALMCASHNSEEEHVQRARAMLATVNAQEHELRCGGHPSINPTVNDAWIRKGYKSTPINNNCSGKHIGMLAAARLMHSQPLPEYHDPTHPFQLCVKAVVDDMARPGPGELSWAIDGCNLPTPALPLTRIGRGFAELAYAADSHHIHDQRTEVAQRVYRAMWKHPDMVGGEGRFCTDLMTAYNGALIGKVGADGCYAVAIRASEQTRHLGSDGPLGLAVKIEDGSLEMLYAAVVEILEQLDIGSPEARQTLVKYHHLRRTNTMEVVTGNVTMNFRIRALERKA